jgi:hypothetical protein
MTLSLRRAELRASTDSVKMDLELVCLDCGEHLCDAEAGDRLDILADVADDHHARCDAHLRWISQALTRA